MGPKCNDFNKSIVNKCINNNTREMNFKKSNYF